MSRVPVFFAIVAAAFLTACSAAPENTHVIGFYNVENLFDVNHDEGKNDSQFLPDGSNAWTQDKYECKLRNIAQVINAMAEENGRYHTVLGLAEVENDAVLRDLTGLAELSMAGYRFVHFESPDARGVDVALLYQPAHFKVLDSKAIPYDFSNTGIVFEKTRQEQADFATRDVLMVRGSLDGEMFAFFVAHLPSRLGDKGSDLRCRGAEIIHRNAVELEQQYPGIKIVVMGDMNDDPTDISMTEYLHGRENIEDVAAGGEFFSPFLSMLKDGFGTLEYKGVWNIFDIIMVNHSLTSGDGYTIRKSDATHYGYVFKKPFMTQQSGRYKGTPFRTFSGGQFINGYSDHYPTYIVIER